MTQSGQALTIKRYTLVCTTEAEKSEEGCVWWGWGGGRATVRYSNQTVKTKAQLSNISLSTSHLTHPVLSCYGNFSFSVSTIRS